MCVEVAEEMFWQMHEFLENDCAGWGSSPICSKEGSLLAGEFYTSKRYRKETTELVELCFNQMLALRSSTSVSS